jgi:hypothetical protein
MVWLHGGGNTAGSGSQSVYDGEALVSHGVATAVKLGLITLRGNRRDQATFALTDDADPRGVDARLALEKRNSGKRMVRKVHRGGHQSASARSTNSSTIHFAGLKPGNVAPRAISYGNLRQREAMKVERVMGIEPTLAAWEAAVLPLNYTRDRA